MGEVKMPRQIRRLLIVALVVLILPLGACAGGRGGKEVGGTLIGAALGGLVGSRIGGGSGQIVATVIGTLLGGFIGNEIGKRLDELDRRKAGQAQYSALEYQPDNTSVVWDNPNTGNYGSFVPTRTTVTRSGQPCREFQQSVTVGGQTERAYGRACRDAGGQWQIVN